MRSEWGLIASHLFATYLCFPLIHTIYYYYNGFHTSQHSSQNRQQKTS